MDHSAVATTTPSRRHLASETVMRIEVSLSSRRSSVVVFNTTVRLVTLGRGAWSSIAYGAPCIVLLRETTAQDSPFQVKFAIAELESGIAVWEEEITKGAEYTELQPGFHSFNLNGQTMAVQFADSSESASFIDSLQQYIAQKERIDQVLDERKVQSKSPKMDRKVSSKKKAKKTRARSGSESSKRISKIDISQPCEFRHLSGITAGHTDVCQKELEGKIERHQRSASMGAISQKQTKQRTRLPDDMTDGKLYKLTDNTQGKEVDGKKQDVTAGSNRGKFKFSSLRITKRKPLIQSDDSPAHKDDLSIGSPKHSFAPQLQADMSSSSIAMTDGGTGYIEVNNDDNNKGNLMTGGTPSPQLPSSENSSSLAINNTNETAVVGSTGEMSPSHVPLSGWQEDMSSAKTSPKHTTQQLPYTKPPSATIPPQQLPATTADNSGLFVVKPIIKSPQRAPLQPLSPQHNKFPSAYQPKKLVSPPNTYDTLEPLDNKNKPKTLLSPPGKIGAPSLLSKMTPLHHLTEPTAATNSSQSNSRVSLPTTSSSSTSTQTSKSPSPIPPSSSDINRDNKKSLLSPPNTANNRASSDLDQLTQELSKVLQDFDELITPRSPFSTDTPSGTTPFLFQPPTTTSGKETMV